MGPDDKARRRLQILVDLIGMAVTIWIVVPEHKRREWLMWTVKNTQKAAQWTACRSGRFGIRRELAGDKDTANAGYSMAYELMTGPYRRIGAWYDKMRYTQ